jgi:hypothetical protein
MKSIYRKQLITAGLIWAGCFAAFVLAYMFLLAPQIKTKRQIERELAEQKQAYNRALERSQAKARIKLNEQIKHLENTLSEFAINSEDSANLIFAISQIANSKRVGEFRIGGKEKRRVSKTAKLKHISEDQIDINFTAGFNQFATLLNALERHRPVVFVDKFEITHSGRDNVGHEVDMNLAVYVTKRQDS